MINDQSKRTTLSISRATKDILDSTKHTGQSYDGLIRELITYWKEQEVKKKPPDVEAGQW